MIAAIGVSSTGIADIATVFEDAKAFLDTQPLWLLGMYYVVGNDSLISNAFYLRLFL